MDMYLKLIITIVVNIAVLDAKVLSDLDLDLDLDVQNSLLNDELSVEDIDGDQPIFINGFWQCGNCDVIDEKKLIYSEINDVETNYITDETIAVVQVGLLLDNMQCITVSTGERNPVRRVWGSCAGADGVTLAVNTFNQFVVNVYGI